MAAMTIEPRADVEDRQARSSHREGRGPTDRMIKLTARATAVPERAGNSGEWRALAWSGNENGP